MKFPGFGGGGGEGGGAATTSGRRGPLAGHAGHAVVGMGVFHRLRKICLAQLLLTATRTLNAPSVSTTTLDHTSGRW